MNDKKKPVKQKYDILASFRLLVASKETSQMKLFSKMLIYFLILFITGNNIAGNLVQNGN